MKENIIYGLRDPITDEYKYVGKSTSGLQRPLSHFVKSHNEQVNQWVAKLKAQNLVPHVDVLEELNDPDDLLVKERYWINVFKDSCKLFNENSIDSIKIRISDLEKQLLTKEKILNAKLYQAENAISSFDNIGNFLKERRKMLHLKQKDAAELTGVSLRTIQSMEKNNSNFTLSTIEKYLNLLGAKLVPVIKIK
jgi:DNA-binding XRE family transcriptional regulator